MHLTIRPNQLTVCANETTENTEKQGKDPVTLCVRLGWGLWRRCKRARPVHALLAVGSRYCKAAGRWVDPQSMHVDVLATLCTQSAKELGQAGFSTPLSCLRPQMLSSVTCSIYTEPDTSVNSELPLA